MVPFHADDFRAPQFGLDGRLRRRRRLGERNLQVEQSPVGRHRETARSPGLGHFDIEFNLPTLRRLRDVPQLLRAHCLAYRRLDRRRCFLQENLRLQQHAIASDGDAARFAIARHFHVKYDRPVVRSAKDAVNPTLAHFAPHRLARLGRESLQLGGIRGRRPGVRAHQRKKQENSGQGSAHICDVNLVNWTVETPAIQPFVTAPVNAFSNQAPNTA